MDEKSIESERKARIKDNLVKFILYLRKAKSVISILS